MRNAIRIFLATAALLVSVGVFAQPAQENPDPDPGGSGGGNDCKTCIPVNNYAHCYALRSDADCFDSNGHLMGWCNVAIGYSSCVPRMSPTGSAYCDTSGTCAVAQDASTKVVGHQVEDQIAGIRAFLIQDGVISDADLNDFIAVTDFALRGEPYAVAAQKRLAAYRAEFNRLVARGDPLRELKPGHIPVMPHKPTKAPAVVTALAGGRERS